MIATTSIVVGGLGTAGAAVVATEHLSAVQAAFTIGASLCAILAFIGGIAWRLGRRARHLSEMLTSVHAALYGRPEVRDGGVVVEHPVVGLRDRMETVEHDLADIKSGATPALRKFTERFERHTTATNEMLDRHAREIAEAKRVAGEAATRASALTERFEVFNSRYWEWIDHLRQRDEALTVALADIGLDVGTAPREPGVDA